MDNHIYNAMVNDLLCNMDQSLSLYCFFGAKLSAILESNIAILTSNLHLKNYIKSSCKHYWKKHEENSIVECYFDNDHTLRLSCFLKNNNVLCIKGELDNKEYFNIETRNMLLRFEDLKFFDDKDLRDVQIPILSIDGFGCKYYLVNGKFVELYYYPDVDRFSGTVEEYVNKDDIDNSSLLQYFSNKYDGDNTDVDTYIKNTSSIYKGFNNQFKVGQIVSDLNIRNLNYHMELDIEKYSCMTKVVLDNKKVLYDGKTTLTTRILTNDKYTNLVRNYPPDKRKLLKTKKNHKNYEADTIEKTILLGMNDASLILKKSFVK